MKAKRSTDLFLTLVTAPVKSKAVDLKTKTRKKQLKVYKVIWYIKMNLEQLKQEE
jgi:hypothetical protein